MPENISELFNHYLDDIVAWLPSLGLALIVLIVGMFIVKRLNRLLEKSLSKSKIEEEIRAFLLSLLDLALRLTVILLAASFLGFQLSALVGILAAMAFAVGLALQGFMGNFASGLTIIFFKPYRIGDWVEISEKFGQVETIQLFNTHLSTPNNKRLVVPNGQVTDNIITNFSKLGYIRLELEVLIAYEEDAGRICQLLKDALSQSPYIINQEKLLIGINKYDTHNVILAIRPPVEPDDYWDATFDLNGRIKICFHENNIKMAYSEGIELGPIGK